LAWRSQVGWVLVGWALAGRLWDRSLLGIYAGWLGLELPVRAATGVNRMCSAETKRCKNDAFRRPWRMSAFGGKADIPDPLSNVC